MVGETRLKVLLWRKFSFQGLTMHDAKYFFKAVREGDVVTFATNEENERHSWVQALYRATGQSHKPTPPITPTTKSSQGPPTAAQKEQLGNEETLVLQMIEIIYINNCFFSTEAERSKKLGFDEYIQSDPCKFDHHDLFKMLQIATLEFRLNDPYCSLVR